MTRASAFSTRVEAIDWQDVNPDGTKSATVVGTREAGVAFSYAFFIPAGVWDAPHSHVAAAHLVVARGELRLGYGSELDREAAEVFPAGSFLYVPAGAVHFDGAERDTVLLGTAVGPWSTDYVNAGGSTPAGATPGVGAAHGSACVTSEPAGRYARARSSTSTPTPLGELRPPWQARRFPHRPTVTIM